MLGEVDMLSSALGAQMTSTGQELNMPFRFSSSWASPKFGSMLACARSTAGKPQPSK